MNKTGKIKSRLANYPIWIYQNLWLKIISKLKPSSLHCNIADEQKKVGKKDLANFALPMSCSTEALSDLLENTWRSKKMGSGSKKVFALNKPAWK